MTNSSVDEMYNYEYPDCVNGCFIGQNGLCSYLRSKFNHVINCDLSGALNFPLDFDTFAGMHILTRWHIFHPWNKIKEQYTQIQLALS